MKKLLTQKLVDSAELPRHGSLIIRDTHLKGFGLRITSGGSSSYIVEARVNGKNTRLTVGRADLMSLEEARQKGIVLLFQMTSGVDPQIEKQKEEAAATTLGEVLDHYLTVQKLKPSTRKGYQHNITTSFRDWLAMPLTSITPAMVLARHKEMPRPNKFGTSGQACANHAVKKLSALINFAINNLGVEMTNPVAIMNKNRAWYKLSRVHVVIADHQLPAYWKAVQSLKRESVRDFFLLLLLTGLRRGEALTLTWRHIDFEAKTLTIPPALAKNHHEHVLPLSNVLLALLEKRKKQSSSEWVFPNHSGKKHMAHQSYSSVCVRTLFRVLKLPHPYLY